MKFFLFVAFIAGMAVTVIELAAARLLAPYFGASLFVWTNVIGIILISLAIGYSVGGRLADRRPEAQLLFRCFGVAAFFIALAPFIVKWIAPALIVEGIFTRTISLVLVVGSFVTGLFLFFVPVLLLGMTSPFLIRLASEGEIEGVGTVSGRIFGWSTAGSIVGVFAAGLFFLPFFGTRATLFGSAVLLGLLWAWGEVRRLRALLFVVALIALVAAVPLGALRASTTLIYERESPYQYIRVEEIAGSRYLIFNEGNSPQSVWHPDTLATGFYYDYIATLPLFFPEEKPLKILLVGLGGGTIPTQYASLYKNRSYTIDAVEIDPAVVDTAQHFFHLSKEHLALTVADGRTFLAASREQYDLIILDAFAQQYYIPWHLTTKEFFTIVRAHLAPGGLVAFNVDAASATSPLLEAMVRTTQAVFPFVATASMPNSWNQIVFARDTPIDFITKEQPENDFLRAGVSYLTTHVTPRKDMAQSVIFTDDRAPVELLTDTMFLREAVDTL